MPSPKVAGYIGSQGATSLQSVGTGFTTAEGISGIRAASLNQSGQLQIAMAAVSGRMPAVGVVTDGVLSGTFASVFLAGAFQFASGLADYSGYVGKRVWVGRSGQVTTISGSWSSGGFASGDIGQPLGIISNSGGIVLAAGVDVWSGGPIGTSTAGVP